VLVRVVVHHRDVMGSALVRKQRIERAVDSTAPARSIAWHLTHSAHVREIILTEELDRSPLLRTDISLTQPKFVIRVNAEYTDATPGQTVA
jgi:hypothetical protein